MKMNPTNNVFIIIRKRMQKCFYTVISMYNVVKKVTYVIMFGCLPLSNKLVHALVGNKLKGYHVAVWNCAMGLILPDCSTSDKAIKVNYQHQKSLINYTLKVIN